MKMTYYVYMLAGLIAAMPLHWPTAAGAVAVNVSPTYGYIVTDGGAGGYEAFPDICRLQNGDILCTFYAGYAHVSPPNETYSSGGRIMQAVSKDNGATWSAPSVVYDGPLDDRDSSICQLPNGRLLCNFFTYDNGSGATYITTSDDLGATWSAPSQITADRYYTSSPIIRLSSGRLVLGLYAVNSTNTWANGAVATSDDDGDTWSNPIQIPTSVKLNAETSVIELTDGTLWAALRNNKSSSPMYYSTSADEGDTWTTSQPLGFHAEAPYLWRSEQGAILLGYRAYKNGVYSTALRYSLDECATWSDEITIDPLGGAYTSMVNLNDGSVLVAYFDRMGDVPTDIRTRIMYDRRSAGTRHVGAAGDGAAGDGAARLGGLRLEETAVDLGFMIYDMRFMIYDRKRFRRRCDFRPRRRSERF
ncbi:MAG: exo-alpha-sialidase [Pirellulales bacterium]|nr:exo-alpha-sialidase [Pirellulales bacterium]